MQGAVTDNSAVGGLELTGCHPSSVGDEGLVPGFGLGENEKGAGIIDQGAGGRGGGTLSGRRPGSNAGES